ncbi:ATP-binding cassette domain-containing protein [Plantactinospora sp. B5E13]|uniref:ABC transporter ATP-binding protein n=1 Tax=unclassified Plantactinospora TaxID=2631981 RepID=UPI00325F6E6F
MRSAVRLFATRIRLLRLLAGGGGIPTGALVGVQLVRAVVPTAQALSVGHLVAVFGRGELGGPVFVAAALVAGLLLVDQWVWLTLAAVRNLVVRRIDGGLRAGLRTLAVNLPGLDRLESREFQDRAARAVDVGSGFGRDRSPGTAATGQLELVFRMVGAVSATVLLATFSVPLAVGLLAVSLLIRATLRRQWLGIIDVLDADTVGHRRNYYVSEQAVHGAAKDVRLFGLSDWFAGRLRATSARTYGPVWRRQLAVLRRQWWIVLLAAGLAVATMAVPAGAVFAGSLDPARMITYVLAGFGIMEIGRMGEEAFDIEYGLRGIQATDELAAEYRATGRSGTPTTTTPRRPAGPEPASGPASASGPKSPTGREGGTPESAADRGGAGSPPVAGPPTIRFEEVVFRYPGATRPVLDGLTLTLRPGETVALVGENGVGKTTFVKLLGGLYRPDSGRITLDGVDLAALDPALWRQRLAVLFQDFVRYPASLRDNVALAAAERITGGPADDRAVRDALDRAGATKLLAGLPDGLDSSLWRAGTGGTDLSGGQWQRVALARVLYAVAAGRRVLVLDEPTAHLDVRAEAEFHERVVSRVRETTTLLISHRLATVRPAGRIILLRAGRVAEDGPHDELMALGGGYARFFTVQAEAFTAAGERRRAAGECR